MAKIKFTKKNEGANANESIGAVTRNPGDRYKESFMIDCGTPENALALADAMTDEAYGHPAGGELDDAGRHFLGGELIQCWPVGHFFTASVDPCEKAIAWCRDFLRNLGGSAPGITGNSAGLEKRVEALSPKLQKRRKFKTWQDATMQMKGFEEAGYSFLDLYKDGACLPIIIPVTGYETEDEALAAAKKLLDDFDEYLEVTAQFDEEGGLDGEPVWFPSFNLKNSFVDLPEGEGLEVLSELSDVLYRVYTMGESKASEDRRGTDRYGHSVRRFTTKDLTDAGDDAGDDAGSNASSDKFGLAYMDTTSIDAFSNNYDTGVRDRFLHDLAQMPVSKKSIEDLLRKYQLHRWGRTVAIRDFFPENGIAYLGTMGPDGLPYKSLYLKWGPALKK